MQQAEKSGNPDSYPPACNSGYAESTQSQLQFQMDVPFPRKEDSLLDPTSVRKQLCKTLESAGCKKVRFHDLRHTFATIAPKYGMDAKTHPTVIGHSSAATTLNIYAHITDDLSATAAVNIDQRIVKQEQAEIPAKKTTPEKSETNFAAIKGQRRKPGTGCLSQIGEHPWQ